MKVLVVVQTTNNIRYMPHIIRELKNKGHQISIYTHGLKKADMERFRLIGIELKPLKKLTQNIVNEFDVAFVPPVMSSIHQIISSNIYTFSYTSHLTHFLHQDASDFVFTPHANLSFDYVRDCVFMTVGNVGEPNCPNNRVLADKKRFLYIDSGHMPFGAHGGMQIAETLLIICKNFPDYELCIKPRWLPDESYAEARITHKNTLHVYDLIKELCSGDIPTNLNMLMKHYEMQDLVSCSDVVISLYTTAIMEALKQDKPLVTLCGWECEPEAVMSIKYITCLENWHRETGCLVDIYDVNSHLPNGIKCSETFLQKYLPYRDDSSKRIVEVMENIYERYFAIGKMPMAGSYSYENYEEAMQYGDLNYSHLIRNRYKETALREARTRLWQVPVCVDFFSRTNAVIDEFIDEHEVLTLNHFHNLMQIGKSEVDSIIISNHALFMSDDISQSLLFDALHNSNRIIDIVKTDNVLCKSPYYFYQALYHESQNDAKTATKFYVRHLREVNSRGYQRYIQDTGQFVIASYSKVFNAYNGTNINPDVMYNLFNEMYKHKNDHLIPYNIRKKIYDFLPKISTELEKISNTSLANDCKEMHESLSDTYKISRENYAQTHSRSLRFVLKLTHFMPSIFHKGLIYLNNNGLKFTIKFAVNKVKNSTPMRIYLQYRSIIKSGFVQYKQFIFKHGTDSIYCCVGDSSFDTCVLASMCKAISDRSMSSRKLVIHTTPSFKGIADLFVIKSIETVSKMKLSEMIRFFMFMQSNDANITSFHYHPRNMHFGVLKHVVGVRQTTDYDFLQMYNSVADDEIGEPHVVSDIDYFIRLFHDNDLTEGKTVAIMPQASTSACIPTSFWTELVVGLAGKGYSVVTLLYKENEIPLYGTIGLRLPYDVFVGFVKRAGCIVGMRNVLFDIVGNLDCVQIALFDYGSLAKVNLVASRFDLYRIYNKAYQKKRYNVIYYDLWDELVLEQVIGLVDYAMPINH